MHFVAPNQRPQITAHRFETPRILFVKTERAAIAESHHDGEIEILRKMVPDRQRRTTRLHPNDPREPMQALRRALQLDAVLSTVGML